MAKSKANYLWAVVVMVLSGIVSSETLPLTALEVGVTMASATRDWGVLAATPLVPTEPVTLPLLSTAKEMAAAGEATPLASVATRLPVVSILPLTPGSVLEFIVYVEPPMEIVEE